jgi:hypothetical protein
VPDHRTRHLPRGFAEGQAKLDARNARHQRFVEVLDGLDEVRLTEDEVGRFRLVDRYRDELHLEPLLEGRE